MSTLTIELPDLLKRQIEALAAREGYSVSQFLASAAGEKLAVLTTMDYGIPQNLDPSSFYASVFLTNVDLAMINSRHRYFRWVDDIRICSKNPSQAMRALHELQAELRKRRQFLASDKTRVVLRDTPEWNDLFDVSDDVQISQFEDIVKSRDCDAIARTIPAILECLERHSGAKGDDRKFRAYANRLLDAADFEALRDQVIPAIRQQTLARLAERPERTDYWVKFLSGIVDDSVLVMLKTLLVTNPSMHDWQRFLLWKLLLTYDGSLPRDFLDKAKELCSSTLSDLVTSAAILVLGKHGNNGDRQNLYQTHFSTQRAYCVQRAIIVATQELTPLALRDRFYQAINDRTSDHAECISFIQDLNSPDYGYRPRSTKICMETPRVIQAFMHRGVGLVGGKQVNYRLSYRDVDYE